MRIKTEGRHPSTVHIAQFFAYGHLPEGPLRHLLEAKDCFVRAALTS